MRSPRIRRSFRENISNFLAPLHMSNYKIRLCTISSFFMSFWKYGDQNWTAYSRCGLTNEVYKRVMTSGVLQWKLLAMNPKMVFVRRRRRKRRKRMRIRRRRKRRMKRVAYIFFVFFFPSFLPSFLSSLFPPFLSPFLPSYLFNPSIYTHTHTHTHRLPGMCDEYGRYFKVL